MDRAAEEAYWAHRIENLKRAHEKINSGMHIEYQKTLKEANELFELAQKDKIVSKLPPCQEEKAKVSFSLIVINIMSFHTTDKRLSSKFLKIITFFIAFH